ICALRGTTRSFRPRGSDRRDLQASEKWPGRQETEVSSENAARIKMTRAEAFARATEAPAEHLQRILDSPPDRRRWCDLHLVARSDPDRAAALREAIKRAALEEL